jgi:hypothetical protein
MRKSARPEGQRRGNPWHLGKGVPEGGQFCSRKYANTIMNRLSRVAAAVKDRVAGFDTRALDGMLDGIFKEIPEDKLRELAAKKLVDDPMDSTGRRLETDDEYKSRVGDAMAEYVDFDSLGSALIEGVVKAKTDAGPRRVITSNPRLVKDLIARGVITEEQAGKPDIEGIFDDMPDDWEGWKRRTERTCAAMEYARDFGGYYAKKKLLDAERERFEKASADYAREQPIYKQAHEALAEARKRIDAALSSRSVPEAKLREACRRFDESAARVRALGRRVDEDGYLSSPDGRFAEQMAEHERLWKESAAELRAGYEAVFGDYMDNAGTLGHLYINKRTGEQMASVRAVGLTSGNAAPRKKGGRGRQGVMDASYYADRRESEGVVHDLNTGMMHREGYTIDKYPHSTRVSSMPLRTADDCDRFIRRFVTDNANRLSQENLCIKVAKLPDGRLSIGMAKHEFHKADAEAELAKERENRRKYVSKRRGQPLLDGNGNPVLDGNGNPVPRWDADSEAAYRTVELSQLFSPSDAYQTDTETV